MSTVGTSRNGCRAIALFSLWLLSPFWGCGATGETTNAIEERNIVATQWDTTLVIGTANPADTSLLQPSEFVLWGERIAVLDGANQVLRTFSRDGRLLWSVSRRGGGPGEMRQAHGMAVGSQENLWLIDARNAKIMVIGRRGVVLAEKPIRHLPVLPSSMLLGSDTLIFTTQSPAHGVMIVTEDSLRLLDSRPFPWPEPLDPRFNLSMYVAGSYRNGWVGAFTYGPGFVVTQHGSSSVHRYIEHVPWALKSGPRVRAMGADSARFGATGLSVVGDEIFMLFGGRPYRQAHDDEPTRTIDVYGMDGEYRRSYRLPSDAWEMATRDGELFYVLTHDEHGYPFLLGLRPRENRDRGIQE